VLIGGDKLKCLAFICLKRLGNRKRRLTPVATCFVVELRAPSSDLSWEYLVTSRHVIEQAESDFLHVRFNLKSGGTKDVETHRDSWLHHPSADVSAIAMPDTVAPTEFDYYPMPSTWFLGPGPEYRWARPDIPGIDGWRPDIGDEVCAIGLFVQHYGKGVNLPVARFGHISRTPSTMRVKRYEGDRSESVAWLVEMLSWGGVSGSPVLAACPVSVENRRYTAFAVLGVAHGHFHRPQNAKVTGDVLGKISTKMNTGLAIVTPSCAITELLDSDFFVKRRREIIESVNDGEYDATIMPH